MMEGKQSVNSPRKWLLNACPPESGALLCQHLGPSWPAVTVWSHESVFASQRSLVSGIGSFHPARVFQFLHLVSSFLGYLFFRKKCTLLLPVRSAEHHYGQSERQKLWGYGGHNFPRHCGSLWILVQNIQQYCIILEDNWHVLVVF